MNDNQEGVLTSNADEKNILPSVLCKYGMDAIYGKCKQIKAMNMNVILLKILWNTGSKMEKYDKIKIIKFLFQQNKLCVLK